MGFQYVPSLFRTPAYPGFTPPDGIWRGKGGDEGYVAFNAGSSWGGHVIVRDGNFCPSLQIGGSKLTPVFSDINGYIYNVNKIAEKACFNNTTVKSVYIGTNVTVIEINAFYGCTNLEKVSGGENLKVIGQNAFARCTKLSTFVITSKVLYKIGPQAFYKDSKLKTIYIRNTTKLTKSGVKKSLKGSSVKTVKVKKSKVKAYKKYFTKKNCGKNQLLYCKLFFFVIV